MDDLLLIHHAARRQHTHPPSSLSAVRDCLDSGARVVEVDISPLADGGFALLHEGDLARVTDGQGPAHAATRAQVRSLHYAYGDRITGEPVALLSHVVALVGGYCGLDELQLDLKPHAPLNDAVLQALIATIAPIAERVRVTSVADWALRRFRSLTRSLGLGFDPLLYLGVPAEEDQDTTVPPFRIGAYGYADDHPLGTRVWGPPHDYLEARADALFTQAPADCAWYIDASLLCSSLDDGFDWIAFLHARGAIVDAWTLDADAPGALVAVRRLVAAGVDRITTNDPPALASALRPEGTDRATSDHRRIAY